MLDKETVQPLKEMHVIETEKKAESKDESEKKSVKEEVTRRNGKREIWKEKVMAKGMLRRTLLYRATETVVWRKELVYVQREKRGLLSKKEAAECPAEQAHREIAEREKV